MSMKRPNDKIVYAPLKHQFQGLQTQRDATLSLRRGQNSVRPEKKNGLARQSRIHRTP